VTIRDGIVALMGHVGTYGENHAAETAALRVKDVKAVAEEIEVKLPYDVKHANKETADAAVNLMAWPGAFPSPRLRSGSLSARAG